MKTFANSALYCVTLCLIACFAVDASAQSEHDIKISGGTLHYKTLGSGPPLLLLAGGPGFSADYLVPVAEKLSVTHQCILLDQRGTGKSRLAIQDTSTVTLADFVDDIEILRKHLNIDKFTLLGHSWGGILAMAYAAGHPGPVNAMVLVASGGINLEFQSYLQANIRTRLLPSELSTSAYWTAPSIVEADPWRASFEQLRAILPAYVFDRSNTPKIIEVIDRESFNPQISPLMWPNLQKIHYDLRSDLKDFRQPVLQVQGRQDMIGESTAYLIHQTIPNSELRFIEECGHFPWVEKPEKFYEVVQGFLQGIQ